MSDEFLGERRRSLEDSFFAKENQKALAGLRKQNEERAAMEALARVSRISDEAVLARLLELGIGAETLAALTLVPLIEVAWADGRLDPKEREAVLSGAESVGIAAGSAAHEMLGTWLKMKPERILHDTWRDFIRALVVNLSADERSALKQQVLGQARSVAEAAGGFLGLGSKVSREEKTVLAALENAFEG